MGSAGSQPVGAWTRRVLVANVVVQAGIVLTGGLVRLTGSGLGCPTWPDCDPGSLVPVAPQGYHPYVEFGNRLLTFVVGAVAVATLVAVWRLRPRRPALRPLAAVPLVGTVAQALLGGVTVLTGLHPTTVAAHFLLSAVLVAASTWLLLRAREGDGPARPLVRREVRVLARALAGVTAVVLVLGTVVTGSGPHSGDADTPARLDLDPRTASWLHADAVWLLCGLLLALLVALQVGGGPALARRRAWTVAAVVVAQGVVGYVQYALDLPVLLVLLHMAGAVLLVVAVTALLHAMRERVPAGAASVPAPGGPVREAVPAA